MLDITDIPQVDLGSPGPARDALVADLQALMDLANAPAATAGVSSILALDGSSNPVRAAPFAVNVKDMGAKGDGAANDTAAVAAAITALRNAGAGMLFFPRGTYLLDSFDWDWIAGGYGKFVLAGEGASTTLKKRTNNSTTFATIGRNDATQTFQGSVYVRDICFEGFSGGAHNVLEIWSLTTFKFENVRVRYGAKPIVIRNCVTGILENCQGSDAVDGLEIDSFAFPDATFSKSNVITLIGGAYVNNSEWGIVFAGGGDLTMVGVQVEANGTVSMMAGGLYVKSTVGAMGVNRKGRGVNAVGCWFENNAGKSAVVLEGGSSTFEGCQFVANANATRDIYGNGGKYVLIDPSMPTAKTGGNIEDTASAAIGNLIIGGEIAIADAGIDESKTTLIEVQTGTGATATRVTHYKGRAPVNASSATELMVQTGIDNQASGSTVTFPVAFASTPVVILTVSGNAPGRVSKATHYGLSGSGFTIEKTEMISGSNTVSTTSNTVHWIAIGPK